MQQIKKYGFLLFIILLIGSACPIKQAVYTGLKIENTKNLNIQKTGAVCSFTSNISSLNFYRITKNQFLNLNFALQSLQTKVFKIYVKLFQFIKLKLFLLYLHLRLAC